MHLSTMPRVGEIIDGLTVGALMIDQQTGQPYALMVGPVRHDLEWAAANAWVTRLGAGFRLMHRHEAATLFENSRLKPLAESDVSDRSAPKWHWLSEQRSPTFAWMQSGHAGFQRAARKRALGGVLAVLRADIIPQEAC